MVSDLQLNMLVITSPHLIPFLKHHSTNLITHNF